MFLNTAVFNELDIWHLKNAVHLLKYNLLKELKAVLLRSVAQVKQAC